MLGKHFILIFFISLLCVGCSVMYHPSDRIELDTSSKKTQKTVQPKRISTNPKFVELATNKNINHQYQKIATISVNHYNSVGVKRQTGVINDLIRKYAADLGGNAVINIHTERGAEIGEVVKFS